MARRFTLDAVTHGTLLLEWPERQLEHVQTLIETEGDLAEVARPFVRVNVGDGAEADAPAEPIRYSHEELGEACDALAEVIRNDYPNMDQVAASLGEVLDDLEELPLDEIFEPRLAE